MYSFVFSWTGHDKESQEADYICISLLGYWDTGAGTGMWYSFFVHSFWEEEIWTHANTKQTKKQKGTTTRQYCRYWSREGFDIIMILEPTDGLSPELKIWVWKLEVCFSFYVFSPYPVPWSLFCLKSQVCHLIYICVGIDFVQKRRRKGLCYTLNKKSFEMFVCLWPSAVDVTLKTSY